MVGTVSDLAESNPEPSGCMPSEKSIVYKFEGGGITSTFNTRYYYVDGTDEAGDTYEFSPDKSKECILQNLTLW